MALATYTGSISGDRRDMINYVRRLRFIFCQPRILPSGSSHLM